MRPLILALSVFALVGCEPSVHGPIAPSSTPQHGVADDATWMTLASHGARLRVPDGWAYSSESGHELRAEPGDKKAVLILTGATSKQDFETKVRGLGARYGLDEVDFSRAKPGNINGIEVLMFEDQAAESGGKAGDVFVLLGEAPNGKGVLVLFLWAADDTQKYDVELIKAANTLRPI
ncbi:MAG: hypothetical protein ACXWP4_10570 [Polyangiales bacterium]